jgi:hypothetical protein
MDSRIASGGDRRLRSRLGRRCRSRGKRGRGRRRRNGSGIEGDCHVASLISGLRRDRDFAWELHAVVIRRLCFVLNSSVSVLVLASRSFVEGDFSSVGNFSAGYKVL